MPSIRKCVAALSLFVMVSVTGSTISARQNEPVPGAQHAQSQAQNRKATPKGWIAKILDVLTDKLSTPPG
jgi:hypothetical protein